MMEGSWPPVIGSPSLLLIRFGGATSTHGQLIDLGMHVLSPPPMNADSSLCWIRCIGTSQDGGGGVESWNPVFVQPFSRISSVASRGYENKNPIQVAIAFGIENSRAHSVSSNWP